MPINSKNEPYEIREKGGSIYHFYPWRPAKDQWVYIRWNDANLAGVGLNPDGSKVAGPGPAPAPAPAPIEPFFSADDLRGIGEFNADFETKLAQLDRAFGDLQVQTTYDKTNVDRSAKQNTASSTDQMIARGLFQSSIKDAAVYDIEAQRNLQQKFLDDRLTTAQLDTDRQKKTLADAKTAWQNALNAKSVENAARLSADQPAPPAPAPPAPAAPQQNPWKTFIRNGWVWRRYTDGRPDEKIRPQSGGG